MLKAIRKASWFIYRTLDVIIHRKIIQMTTYSGHFDKDGVIISGYRMDAVVAVNKDLFCVAFIMGFKRTDKGFRIVTDLKCEHQGIQLLPPNSSVANHFVV